MREEDLCSVPPFVNTSLQVWFFGHYAFGTVVQARTIFFTASFRGRRVITAVAGEHQIRHYGYVWLSGLRNTEQRQRISWNVQDLFEGSRRFESVPFLLCANKRFWIELFFLIIIIIIVIIVLFLLNVSGRFWITSSGISKQRVRAVRMPHEKRLRRYRRHSTPSYRITTYTVNVAIRPCDLAIATGLSKTVY